jgi:hypothetical protein
MIRGLNLPGTPRATSACRGTPFFTCLIWCLIAAPEARLDWSLLLYMLIKFQGDPGYTMCRRSIFFLPLLTHDLNICLIPVFHFLGAFANWRIAAICFVMCIRQSIHLSVHPHGTTRFPLDGFSWNLRFKNFSKTSVEKSFIKIWQEKWELYVKTNIHLWSSLAQFFLGWEWEKFIEIIKTHLLYLITFSENRVLYEILWENMAERSGPHMTIWRMRIACCTLKATNTHSGYVIIISFPLQQYLQKMGFSVTSPAHCLSCVQRSKARTVPLAAITFRTYTLCKHIVCSCIYYDFHSKHRLLSSKAFDLCLQWKTILLTARYGLNLYIEH